jgi:hypothetical protein
MEFALIQKIINDSVFDETLFDKEKLFAIVSLLRIFNKIDLKKLQHYKDMYVSISLKPPRNILLIHTSYTRISLFRNIRHYTLIAKSPPAPDVFLIKIDYLNTPLKKYIFHDPYLNKFVGVRPGMVEVNIFIADAKEFGYKIVMNLWFRGMLLHSKLYLNDRKEIKKYEVSFRNERLEPFEKTILLTIFNKILINSILEKIDYINKKNLNGKNCKWFCYKHQ